MNSCQISLYIMRLTKSVAIRKEAINIFDLIFLWVHTNCALCNRFGLLSIHNGSDSWCSIITSDGCGTWGASDTYYRRLLGDCHDLWLLVKHHSISMLFNRSIACPWIKLQLSWLLYYSGHWSWLVHLNLAGWLSDVGGLHSWRLCNDCSGGAMVMMHHCWLMMMNVVLNWVGMDVLHSSRHRSVCTCSKSDLIRLFSQFVLGDLTG